MEKDSIISINDIAVEGLQAAVHLFRNVDEAVKDLSESEKLLVKLQANKILFHAIEAVSQLVEMERKKK